MLALIDGALPRVPGGNRIGRRTAARAMRERLVPVAERDGVRHQPGIAIGQHRASFAERDRPDCFPRRHGHRPGEAEIRHGIVIDAEQEADAVGCFRRRDEDEPTSSRPMSQSTRPCSTMSTLVRGSAHAASSHASSARRCADLSISARARARSVSAGPVTVTRRGVLGVLAAALTCLPSARRPRRPARPRGTPRPQLP